MKKIFVLLALLATANTWAIKTNLGGRAMTQQSFLLISDSKIQSVKVQECNEPLVDLRELGFKIRPHHIVHYEGNTLVRKSVADKLIAAKAYLPKGMEFYFSEGLRPLTVQKQIYDEHYQHLAKTNPTWDKSKLREETAKFVAPPEDVPPHSTGGAIDLTLIDEHGNEVDMGSGLDETPDKNENKSFTHAPNVSDIGKKNRKILSDALTAVGFVNYPTEWWHWSYGDKYWAYHTKAPHSLYGSIKK